MKSVAVSKLKASLSRYLSQVKAGDEILITEHGKPVAKIIPLSQRKDEISTALLVLERAGLVKTGTGNIPKTFWTRPRPEDKKNRARTMLRQEREEGR